MDIFIFWNTNLWTSGGHNASLVWDRAIKMMPKWSWVFYSEKPNTIVDSYLLIFLDKCCSILDGHNIPQEEAEGLPEGPKAPKQPSAGARF